MPRGGALPWCPRSPQEQTSAHLGQPCSPHVLVSLPQAFNVVFEKAIQKTAPAEEVRQRVVNLTDEITYSVYTYTARGLFERDKLIFLAQVTFQVTSGLTPQCGALVGPCRKCRFLGPCSDLGMQNLHFNKIPGAW